jgi:hypothetical protein
MVRPQGVYGDQHYVAGRARRGREADGSRDAQEDEQRECCTHCFMWITAFHDLMLLQVVGAEKHPGIITG